MTDKTELSLLLDYYGSFLTERKRELMRYSADEDMSLSEIAELAGVSRQSVRDSIQKGSEELLLYESRLGLIARDRELNSIADELIAAADGGGGERLLMAARSAAARLKSLIG